MTEQRDYSGGSYSPQQHMTLRMDGGTVAIAISLVALGAVLAGCILMPHIMEKSAIAAAAPGLVRAQIAEREARVALDTTQQFQVELAKRGIEIKR